MVKPRNLQEIAISIAIIRPGPSKSGMKDAYIENYLEKEGIALVKENIRFNAGLRFIAKMLLNR